MGRRRKGRKVSAEEVEKMVQLYAELGTYKAVIQIPEKSMQMISKNGETRRMKMMYYQVGIISKEQIQTGIG